MNRVRVQTAPFDLMAEVTALTSGRHDIGAMVTFTGHVRADDALTTLTLEHYPGMTEAEIGRQVDLARERWPLLGATVVHRTGTLEPGEAIVLVVTAASHRQAAFEAAEFLMDYLKTRAPFWKEERRGSETRWVESRDSDAARAARWSEPPKAR